MSPVRHDGWQPAPAAQTREAFFNLPSPSLEEVRGSLSSYCPLFRSFPRHSLEASCLGFTSSIS